MNKHRIQQLLDRIEGKKLADCRYFSNGYMCVVGHMADMAGVLWEPVSLYDAPIPLAEAREVITAMPRIANHIAEHFEVSVEDLENLQFVNDRYDGDSYIVAHHIRSHLL